MSDTTTAEQVSPEEQAAIDELAALEQAAFEGKTVTPMQVVEARERVTLARKMRAGVEHRAEQKRLVAAAAAKVRAKKEAAHLLSDHNGAEIQAAYEQLQLALSNLAEAIGRYNDKQSEVVKSFRSVGLPHITLSHPDDVPADFDPANHLSFTSNRYDPAQTTPDAVVVDGVTHTRISPRDRAQRAFDEWASK